MNQKNNITVVIPVHNTTAPDFVENFNNALKSVAANTVLPESILIVGSDADLKSIPTLISPEYPLKVNFLVNKGSTDFASQMNYAVSKVSTEYFSFLEFDDEYSDLWFRNVEKYIAEYPGVSAFLPIISDSTADKKFLGYTNEIAWAYEFTDKHGCIDAETLKEYPNFNPDGMVMKVADFLKIGGYKKNIKLTFNLEFLLRACDQALQVMIIPKIGYQHTNMRPSSLFWNYKNGDNKLTPEESEFWMETAKKEFYYADDRPIQYIPQAPAEDEEKQ